MSIKLYMDVHVPYAITKGLRLRDVDVLTAQEDGTAEIDDPELLDRAMVLDRVLFTQDKDFLVEATRRQRSGENFAGVVFAHQHEVTVGLCIEYLELIAKLNEPEEMANLVVYLPF